MKLIAKIPKWILVFAGVLFIGHLAGFLFGEKLLFLTYNPSPSEARGLYLTLPIKSKDFQIGQKVVIKLDAVQIQLLHQYKIFTGNAKVIKTIYAGPGDRLRIDEDRIEINGKPIETLPILKEANGLKIDRARFDGIIPNDNYFVVGINSQRSIDSRYFGLIHRGQIIKKAKLLFLTKKEDSSNV